MADAEIENARRQALSPVPREGPAEAIVRRIGEAIGSGILAPGEQLPAERELATMLGVAPMTLRQATAALREAGLLETRRGRGGGTFVALEPRRALAETGVPISAKALRELTLWRRAVSGEIAAQTALAATPADVERIEASARTVDEAADDRAAFRLADSRFHLVLAELAGSERLTSAEMAIQAELGEVLQNVPSPVVAAHLSAAGHDPIVAAIAAREPVSARQAMESHVESTYDWVAGYRLGLD